MPKPKNDWKVTFKDILIPILSTIVALAGIASGVFMQQSATRSEIEMQKYEVTFTNNQKNYAEFMKYLQLAYRSATDKDENKYGQNVEQLMYNYYSMEPFLSEDGRRTLYDDIHSYLIFCTETLNYEDINQDGTDTQYALQNFLTYRHHEDKFRGTLCQELFGITPSP